MVTTSPTASPFSLVTTFNENKTVEIHIFQILCVSIFPTINKKLHTVLVEKTALTSIWTGWSKNTWKVLLEPSE